MPAGNKDEKPMPMPMPMPTPRQGSHADPQLQTKPRLHSRSARPRHHLRASDFPAALPADFLYNDLRIDMVALTNSDQLSDEELAATLVKLEQQAHSLTAQKTLLSSRLLSYQQSYTLSAPKDPLPPPTDLAPAVADSQILSFALSRTNALSQHTLTRLHRIPGITAFTVQDPSDSSILLGVRIEVFSRRSFDSPYYALLALVDSVKVAGEQHFAVARHSLPAFLGAGELAREFLPATKVQDQDVEKWVRRVRARVVRYRRRVVVAEDLKTSAEAAARVGDVTESWIRRVEGVSWDLPVEVVTVKWTNGSEAVMKVDEVGSVGKCVVRNKRGARNGELEELMKGDLEGLPGRLGWGRA